MTGYELTLACLALNIFKEARGESLVGQQAVALVALNRANAEKKDTCEVVFAKSQFSWTETDTKDGVLFRSIPNKKSPEWNLAVETARHAFTLKDFTGGATHFHATRSDPKWASELIYVGTWGSHRFYRGKVKKNPGVPVPVFTAGSVASLKLADQFLSAPN